MNKKKLISIIPKYLFCIINLSVIFYNIFYCLQLNNIKIVNFIYKIQITNHKYFANFIIC